MHTCGLWYYSCPWMILFMLLYDIIHVGGGGVFRSKKDIQICCIYFTHKANTHLWMMILFMCMYDIIRVCVWYYSGLCLILFMSMNDIIHASVWYYSCWGWVVFSVLKKTYKSVYTSPIKPMHTCGLWYYSCVCMILFVSVYDIIQVSVSYYSCPWMILFMLLYDIIHVGGGGVFRSKKDIQICIHLTP